MSSPHSGLMGGRPDATMLSVQISREGHRCTEQTLPEKSSKRDETQTERQDHVSRPKGDQGAHPTGADGGGIDLSKADKLDNLQRTMIEILDRIEDHPDAVILALGFYAGAEGLNIIDYFLQGAEPAGVSKLKANVAALESAAASLFKGSATTAIPITLTSFLNTDWQTQDPELPQQYYDALAAKMALGCMGAIYAYAFTRPGFLPALMQLAGSVLKDLTPSALPIIGG